MGLGSIIGKLISKIGLKSASKAGTKAGSKLLTKITFKRFAIAGVSAGSIFALSSWSENSLIQGATEFLSSTFGIDVPPEILVGVGVGAVALLVIFITLWIIRRP